jgi:hypothetical protein
MSRRSISITSMLKHIDGTRSVDPDMPSRLPIHRCDPAVELCGELHAFVQVDRTFGGVSCGDQRRPASTRLSVWFSLRWSWDTSSVWRCFQNTASTDPAILIMRRGLRNRLRRARPGLTHCEVRPLEKRTWQREAYYQGSEAAQSIGEAQLSAAVVLLAK